MVPLLTSRAESLPVIFAAKLSNSAILNVAGSGLGTSVLGLNWEVPAGGSSQGYIASFVNTHTAAANANAGVLIKVGSIDTTTRLLSVESGGVNRFEVRGDGNVGIGTNSPDAKLEVLADVAKGVLINRTFTTSSQTLANIRAYYALAITPFRGGTGGLYFTNYDADVPIIQSVNTSDVAQSLLLNPLGGNVGIGTTTPAVELVVFDSSAASTPRIHLQNNTSGTTATDGFQVALSSSNGYLWNWENGNIIFGTNGSQKMTILAGGNVGIGYTSPNAKLDIYSTATFNSRTSGINVHRPGSYGQYGSFSYNSDTTYFSSTYSGGGAGFYGSFVFEQFNNGSVGREAMRITSTGEANFVKNVNTQLNFHATGGTPSLRLTDSFGSGGQLADFAIEVYNGDFEIKDKKNSNLSRFRIANNGSIFALGLGGTAASNSDVRYSTANGELYYQQSSKRYKTNIVNLENSLDKINSLRPVRYNDIKTNEPACGLIAEETVNIIPEVVFNKKIEGFDKPQIEGINYTDLVPYLIKSIQELKAEIEILKKK